MHFQASASASASNSKELEELNHKLARSEQDIVLLKKQMDQAQGEEKLASEFNIVSIAT